MKLKDLVKTLSWDTKLYILPLTQGFEPIRGVPVYCIRNGEAYSIMNEFTVKHIMITSPIELTVFI